MFGNNKQLISYYFVFYMHLMFFLLSYYLLISLFFTPMDAPDAHQPPYKEQTGCDIDDDRQGIVKPVHRARQEAFFADGFRAVRIHGHLPFLAQNLVFYRQEGPHPVGRVQNPGMRFEPFQGSFRGLQDEIHDLAAGAGRDIGHGVKMPGGLQERPLRQPFAQTDALVALVQELEKNVHLLCVQGEISQFIQK